MKLLQPMTIRRLQVLREELAAPPEEGSLEVESPAEGEPNDSENEPENEGKDDDFRVAIKAGDQVALLVDSGVEGVPFLIGDVLDGVTARDDPVNIHWSSPVPKSTTGVRGQWTADYGRFENKLKPSVELRDRDNIIPVPLVWTKAGFSKGRGGKLTQRCVTLLTEWPMVEQYRSARHGTRYPRVICVQQAARS